MSFLEDDDTSAYSQDWVADIGAQGASLSLNLCASVLGVRVAMADSCSWEIKAIGVKQEGYAHSGFRGSIAELLEKTAVDVDMMRGGYPSSLQSSFDAFLASIAAVLGGDSDVQVVLELRDPSGLTQVHGEPVPWVTRTLFKRSWTEDRDLGLPPPDVISLSEKLSTALEVARLVRAAKHVVAMTGAGISVESGIPPFRVSGDSDSDSIWGKFDAAKMTVQGFNGDEEIATAWWTMKHELLPKMLCAEPNPAHIFFGELHQQGKLHHVVTQNIDSLHQRAGVPAERVTELHGHCRGVICSDHRTVLNPIPYRSGTCLYAVSDEEAREAGYFGDVSLPLCPECSAPLRCETVMFGQPMPDGAMDRAREVIASCDLLFVIGTSLIVQPASELPGIALANSIPVVIVNMDDTQYDEYATGLVRGPAGEFLAAVMAELGKAS